MIDVLDLRDGGLLGDCQTKACRNTISLCCRCCFGMFVDTRGDRTGEGGFS